MNKEEIYDKEIHSLVSEIYKICEDNGIGFLAYFAIAKEDDPTYAAFTGILNEGTHPAHPNVFKAANLLNGD